MSIHIISRGVKAIKISNILLKHTVISACGCQQNSYTTKSSNVLNIEDETNAEQQKKKTSIIPKITLISGDNLSVTTLEEAQKLSKRRDLKLVKIVDLDTKTHRPIYKLMTGSEYYAEELKQRELKKKQENTIRKEKLLILGGNISEHDLATNIRKISKWIAKAYEVRVVINIDGKGANQAEKIYNSLEDALKPTGARFVQKREKGSDMRFQILPPKKNKNDDDKSL